MDRRLRDLVAVCLIASLGMAIGCGSAGEANSDKSSDKPATNRVQESEKVTILAQKGDVTLVKTASGATGYVPTERLDIQQDDGTAAVMNAASELDWQPAPTTPAREEPVPRSIAEIHRARNQLPVLYLSADGSQEFLRPKLVGPFIDPASGKTCWPAYTCTNKSCPGLQAGAGRHAFPGVLNYLTVHADGTYTLGGDEERHGLECPACGAKDGLRPYVLPETAQALEDLAEEHRQRLAWERKNRQQSQSENAF